MNNSIIAGQNALDALIQKGGLNTTLHSLDSVVFKKNHAQASQAVIQQLGFEDLVTPGSGTYHFNGRSWKRIEPSTIKQIIVKNLLGDFSISVVNSIYELIKIQTHREGVVFNAPDKTSVPVENGVLRLKGHEWILEPHSREDFRTILLPVVYDPAAKAPTFDRFLDQIFAGTQDAELRKVALCEALGLSMLATCDYETFYFLYGLGANGKSVLLKIVVRLLGAENVTAVQPSDLSNKFQRGHLEGKLANVVPEIAEGAEISDADLKALVSGELTTAERKFEPPFEFRPIATHFFASNHLPHTRDFSPALFRRAIILNFPNVFDGEKRDVKLSEKLEAEISGILNIALKAAADVIMRGGVTMPPSSIEATSQWRLEADQVAQFVEEVAERRSGEEIASADLFDQYRAWAKEAGILKTLNRKNFSSRLERLGYPLKKGAGGTRMVCGLRLTRWHSLGRVA